jgi:hypothetical protein
MDKNHKEQKQVGEVPPTENFVYEGDVRLGKQ